MSRIHFIGGEKGGGGKSVVARVLAQWFVDKSIPFAAVDGELSQGALIRYYGDFTQSADLPPPRAPTRSWIVRSGPNAAFSSIFPPRARVP